MAGLVPRLSGSANQVVFPPGNHPPESSCPCLSRASTFSPAAKEHVDGRDKHGHDDSGGIEYRRRLAGAVSNANRTAVGLSRPSTFSLMTERTRGCLARGPGMTPVGGDSVRPFPAISCRTLETRRTSPHVTPGHTLIAFEPGEGGEASKNQKSTNQRQYIKQYPL